MKRRFVCAACFVLCLGVMGCGNDDPSKENNKGVPENTEALCSDGIDNDENGKTDCEETDCQWFATCQESKAENTEALCSDGIDNDSNGKTDCEETDCQWFEVCTQGTKAETTDALCSDDKDNDGNGKADCEEESCQKLKVCEKKVVENTQELCADGRDNDNNGAADCADSGCHDLDICRDKEPETTEERCSDGKDNDLNGRADCADANCVKFSICQKDENTEELCADGIDNDFDGVKDCDDDGCASFAHCNTTEACTDGAGSCSGNMRNYCESGSWKQEYCDVGCKDGKCVSCETVYGPDTCVDDVHSYCSNNVHLVQNCEYGCEGVGCRVCLPGQTRCSAENTVQETCTTENEVTQWVAQTCQGVCYEGECKGCSNAGENVCSGNVLKHCTSNLEIETEVCEFGCENNKCRVCAEGQLSCAEDGKTVMKCNSNKLEKAGVVCSSSCVNGACNDENGNHLKDEHEPHLKGAKNCVYDSSCESGTFCDSFIGKCADKCTSSEQCLDGYICRPDGRCAAEAFETFWTLTDSDKKLEIPTKSAQKCNFKIDWGDGKTDTVTSCSTTDLSHTYAKAGSYHVKITGTLDGFKLNNNSASKLREVLSFGPVGLAEGAFANATQLRSLSRTDIPDSTKLVSTAHMFENCSALTVGSSYLIGGLRKWDVSNVVSMESMFENAKNYTEDLNSWNVKKVKNMGSMFFDASNFNGKIGDWNTSNVTDMSYMFYGARKFYGDYEYSIYNWDVGNVTTMSHMFESASNFSGTIQSWNVGKVTNMNSMFKNAKKYDGSMRSWNTSKVTDMSFMFYGATAYGEGTNNEYDICYWDTSNVTDMRYMFYNATSFNAHLSNQNKYWNTSKVTDMSSMFEGASSFNQPLNMWDTSNVRYMDSMFAGASAFNQSLDNWNTSKVTNMTYMFSEAIKFNKDISSWDTSNVKNMSHMFYKAEKFDQFVDGWDVSKVEHFESMFNGASKFSKFPVWCPNKDLSCSVFKDMVEDTSVSCTDIKPPDSYMVGNVITITDGCWGKNHCSKSTFKSTCK